MNQETKTLRRFVLSMGETMGEAMNSGKNPVEILIDGLDADPVVSGIQALDAMGEALKEDKPGDLSFAHGAVYGFFSGVVFSLAAQDPTLSAYLNLRLAKIKVDEERMAAAKAAETAKNNVTNLADYLKNAPAEKGLH